MKLNKTFYILILSCILFISASSNITASGKKENQGVEKKAIFSELNLSNYKKKAYSYTGGESYYKSFNIYYQSYEYDGREYIKDYYFTGQKESEEEIILHAAFEISKKKLLCVVRDVYGEIILDEPCAGDVYFMDKKLFENHDVTFLGFSTSVLKKPVRPKVVYETSDRDEPVEEFLWPVSYDYKTNVIKPFSPE